MEPIRQSTRVNYLVKKYIEGETKDERKARKEADKLRKEQDKAQKSVKPVQVPPQKSVATDTVVQIPKELKDTKTYVVCLKHGSKYSSEYVNKLYNMVKRHTTLPYEFVCFTDDVRGIDPHIRTINLQQIGVYGWWYKVIFFDKNFPLNGTILYFDLDIVINNNIDRLFTYNIDDFVICRDFNRSLRKDWAQMNSSIFRLKSGSMAYVYDDFVKDHEMIMRRLHGDQDWIMAKVYPEKGTWSYWPDDWIQSYKWEMRDRADLAKIGNIRNFTKKAEPRLLPKTCVAVFHGEPHPHQCEDDWVKENWR